jgi:hypothetical protein
MKALDTFELFAAYLQAANKWGCMVATSGEDDLAEVSKAVPRLSTHDTIRLSMHDRLFVIFYTEQEAQEFFETVVGDAGPAKANPYAGPARVFACWGGPAGLLSENT